MSKICFILVAGLDQSLLARTPHLKTLSSFAQRPLKPVTPAVTCTMQATLTTGVLPARHGIIANGLYTHNRPDLHQHLDLSSFPDFRRDVSFWEQSNRLLDAPRFWHGTPTRVAMLFWQNSISGTPVGGGQGMEGGEGVDIVLTPKPTHTPDGQTLTACWSDPANLYAELTAQLGPFPLMNYWGPRAGLASSEWIIAAARQVWSRDLADLHLVYIPHLDYNLQRLGPNHPAVLADLQTLDAALAPLVNDIRNSGGTVIIAGDYAITPVQLPIFPNLVLRDVGLLTTRWDEAGKLLVDHETSAAFAMADHQIAHIYCKIEKKSDTVRVLERLEGIGRVLTTPQERAAAGLDHPRSGDIILLAQPHAWFAHDWWRSDDEKPAWQFGVDIHRKPGYDPRELFFDPIKKCIAQNATLVRGSHGLVAEDPANWPVLLADESLLPPGDSIDATALAPWLTNLLQPK